MDSRARPPPPAASSLSASAAQQRAHGHAQDDAAGAAPVASTPVGADTKRPVAGSSAHAGDVGVRHAVTSSAGPSSSLPQAAAAPPVDAHAASTPPPPVPPSQQQPCATGVAGPSVPQTPLANPYLKSLAAVSAAAGGSASRGGGGALSVKLEGAVGDVTMETDDGETARVAEAVRYMQPEAIRQRFAAALHADQKCALMPDYWTPFADTADIVRRLLPYHIWNVPDEDLRWALAPPAGEARLRAELRAGKGKQKVLDCGDEDEKERVNGDGHSRGKDTAAAPSEDQGEDGDGQQPRKKRRLTQSASAHAPFEPAEPPDRNRAKATTLLPSDALLLNNDDDDDLNLDAALLGDTYAFPSLPLAMSYYWSGLSVQRRLQTLLIRADGGEQPRPYVPAPLSSDASAGEEGQQQTALLAPAQNFDVSVEYLERLAYEEEKVEFARLQGEWRTAQGQLERLQRVLSAAQVPPPARPQVQQSRVSTPAGRTHYSTTSTPGSAAATHSGSPAARYNQQNATPSRPLNQSQVPSGTINPAIPSTPIPLLIPLGNLTQLLAMNINPTPAPHIGPAFRRAILDKPDLQQNPHSLLLAAERVGRSARVRRTQLVEQRGSAAAAVDGGANQAELDALDVLSVAPRAAPQDQAESALLLGISIVAAAGTGVGRMPGPEELAPPSMVMLHISVVLAKLSASQLSSLAALMQSLQAQAQAAAAQAQATQPAAAVPAPAPAAQATKPPVLQAGGSTPAPAVVRPAQAPSVVATPVTPVTGTHPAAPTPPTSGSAPPDAAAPGSTQPASLQPPSAHLSATASSAAPAPP